MKRLTILFGIVLTPALFYYTSATAAENLIMRGTLVDAPCFIRPGDDVITLNFEQIIDKFLYRYKRTPSRPLQIHLEDCDISVFKGVKVTFQGLESTALPGMLKLDAGSLAKGVAVGLENANGNPLPFNVASPTTALQSGDMVLRFNAYVHGEPDAIINRRIGHGPFTATATFVLDYL